MKNLIFLYILFSVAACTNESPKDIDPQAEVRPETKAKIDKAQQENIELEEIDGELDSLIFKLK